MLLQYLNHDCQDKIFTYLGYLDVLNFKLINRFNYQGMILNFHDFLIRRLLQDRIVPTKELAIEFCDKLKETGACVAGSFILDILYNTDFSNDIDIYDRSILTTNWNVKPDDWFQGFNDDSRLKFTQYLYQAGFVSINQQMGPDVIIRPYIHNFLVPEIKERFNIKEEKLRDSNLYSKLGNELKHYIQIIPIAMESEEKSFISKFIKATFDLEICQNYFDGEKVYLKNMNKLNGKFDFIKANTKFIFSIYQSIKDRSEESTIKRMEKYNARGFHITKHPLYEEMKKEIDNIVNDGYENGRNFNIYKYIANGMIDLSRYDT